MSRLGPWLLAALLVTVAVAGMSSVASAGRGAPDQTGSPVQDFDLRLFMSDAEDGEARRSFISDTSRVYAIVAFDNATSQRYSVRMRDLAGNEVFNESVTLSGSGRQARMITVGDFVSSYQRHVELQATSLAEAGAELATLCSNPPSAPVPTEPPANPTPGPTPTPGAWSRWQPRMLDALESSTTSAAALNQTLQAILSLPDVAAVPAIQAEVAAAQEAIGRLISDLEQAERKANPPTGAGAGTPTPDPPPVPDPVGACQLVTDAAQEAATAIGRGNAAVAAFPEDTSEWRMPPTSARYDEGQFSSCVQYSTELVQDSFIAATTPWTVGDAGLPALIFPAPDLVDRSSLGQLRLRLPQGAQAMFAQTVDVAGVNRQAEIGAFVTDAMCNPVDGVTMTLTVDEAVNGSVEPGVADVREGVATAMLTAGITPTLNSAVTGLVCVGPCVRPDGKPAPPITGRTRFSVVGPPHRLAFHVNPNQINALKDERASVSVEVKDFYNRKVADGTMIHVAIAAGDPGMLARLVTPVGSRQSEIQQLGKEVDLTTRNAFTNVPPGDDPGLTYGSDLYLVASNDGMGPVELNANWGTVTAKPEVVNIVSRRLIFLPIIMKAYDVLATPPYSTTPVAPAHVRATPEP